MMTAEMAWALLMFGPPIIMIIGVFIAVGIEMYNEGIGLVEFRKEPIIPKQPSITRCMEYVRKWDDDDDDDEWDDEDEEAALLALMIKYL